VTAPDLDAIRAGTDSLARKHRYPTLDFHRPYVDEPADERIVAEADWADSVADRVLEHDGDRSLTGELPPGFDDRWWDREGQL